MRAPEGVSGPVADMIKLTRMDNSEVYLNSELIAFVEEAPDTRIMLTNGEVYLFRESAEEIVRRIINFKMRMQRGRSSTQNKRYLCKMR